MQRELETVTRIARDAGEIIRGVYAKDFSVAYKSPRDPVTDADRQANALIVKALREAFPEDGIVAEESEDKSDSTAAGRVWYVDPLDGTKEFIAKNGEFAVMIGLAVDGAAKLGVVYQVAKDKLYTGVVGEGAWLEAGGEKRALKVSDTPEAKDLRLVVSRSHRAESIDMVVKRLGITSEMKSGSVGLKVGLIAEQVADLYVHISDKSSLWDACGPEAVLRGAGGRFVRLDGAPYQYKSDDLRTSGGILACNAAAYEKVLPVAEAVAREIGFLEG
ncbi:MAG TPA: 3'(2'),5'-bisphosphate nucleotidase CysQ [Polyangiaceae bacterium LLY-WYZ-15_(1-7)]|nr:3'(2'),5'-bisphosphate nucleotidase CysQ [Myxococcales bacterium]MAT27340.1 3'(2'),5'-bisphosphate nucleotidase CysQ [Sandaracinus sp.]HJK91227.1 3'(2'),5'-bisphosphate nucleotidase CysQ [Polyangiaceae bacterium LLY-WYZ-15_(1-7)]MBJ74075.1 3'(2'),5'-bisphosphate nucleotidase CysQ [Sandaracinus sp.]HJL06571.1 3'(2'),5'-bisphosphate nucleotidase CysQ [Polyangiaceae bacterium LLY-WYZ-15_(1-7)]